MKLIALLVIFCALTRALSDAPPYGPSQFSNVGAIHSLTVTNSSDLFSGGTITVDGITMVIPKNTYVTLPSISVMWSELFIDEIPQLPQLGFPGVSWEATVFGNRVGDSYIVGLVYITQSSVRLIQGFVNAIDLTTGEFWVAGNSAAPGSGIKARLNDPAGRYGLEYPHHPLWTVDAESPSIVAASGFPLCIPRYSNGTDDPLCPLKNRVINGDVPTFIQFKTAATRSTTDPDPNIFAPLMVGDYVTINGIDVEDNLLAVYSLVANLGLYTAPREKPAYIRVEVALMGVPAPANAELGETRAVAFTTDPSTPMQFYALDVDPCTGVETERNIQLVQPFSNNAGDIWGKALFRLGNVAVPPMTKNLGFKLLTGTTTNANGIEAGVYIQPVFFFKFPELLVFGDEMFPFDFSSFPFLGVGSGPFLEQLPGKTLDFPGDIVGQLSPWPGAKAPGTTSCAIATTPTQTPTFPESGSTTLTVVTSSTTSPPVQGTDTVIILDVQEDKGQGISRYTITALSSHTTVPLPKLVATGTGVNPLGLTEMTSLGNGNYILDVAVKHGLDTITVTSSHGGQMTIIVA